MREEVYIWVVDGIYPSNLDLPFQPKGSRTMGSSGSRFASVTILAVHDVVVLFKCMSTSIIL